MKRLIQNAIFIILLLAVFSSCSKKIEDYYTSPATTSNAELSKLFSYMLINDRIKPTYWDYATFVTGVTGKYSQFIGITSGEKMYEPSPSYNQDRWNSYYTNGIMNQFREIEKTYNSLSEAQKEEQYVYLQIAKVVLFDQTSQLIDLWGDIPFSEAGQLNASNMLINAKFDDASEIYSSIIDQLESINTYFSTVSLTTTTKTSLTKQDILLHGDVSLWRKYANSLRLRLLMRISNVDETSAKTKITQMLGAPDTYPLVNSNSENILLKMYPAGQNLYSDGLRTGLTDAATTDGAIAPYYMLNNVMVANNDPRTPVFWDPGDSSQIKLGIPYYGLKSDTTSSAAQFMWSHDYLATYDSATFILNWNVPGVLFTAAEVSFLKAEAYERWSIGTAQTEYEKGINQSITFYFDLNQSSYPNPNVSFTRATLPYPSASDITTYLEETDIAYSGTSTNKLQKIWTQKWLNFFILQAGQAWAEIRRTGYPQLPFIEDPSTNDLPPLRILYPDTEKSYNTTNYNAVSSKDTRDTKIFWDVN